MKLTVFALDGQALGTFFNATDDLCIDIEAARDGDNLFGNCGTNVDLHTMTAVEHLVHLFPVGLALLLNQLEKRRNGEHVVLDDAAVV